MRALTKLIGPTTASELMISVHWLSAVRSVPRPNRVLTETTPLALGCTLQSPIPWLVKLWAYVILYPAGGLGDEGAYTPAGRAGLADMPADMAVAMATRATPASLRLLFMTHLRVKKEKLTPRREAPTLAPAGQVLAGLAPPGVVHYAHPVDDHARLGADDLRVVAGRDVAALAGADLEVSPPAMVMRIVPLRQ